MWIETKDNYAVYKISYVTPHAGVWIETLEISIISQDQSVTPHAGVWIETRYESCVKARPLYVTPHAGVWIETSSQTGGQVGMKKSRLMQACGLKPA